jgi:class 3 adenylate cyclase
MAAVDASTDDTHPTPQKRMQDGAFGSPSTEDPGSTAASRSPDFKPTMAGRRSLTGRLSAVDFKEQQELLAELARLPPSARAVQMEMAQVDETGLRRRSIGGAMPSASDMTSGSHDTHTPKKIPKRLMRERLQWAIEWKWTQAVMTAITLFALYGDDIRLSSFFKEADSSFFAIYLVSFFAFALELTVQSMCMEGYKYSFFFLLDIISTASILPDIPWVMDPITSLFDTGKDSSSSEDSGLGRVGKASRAGTRAGRIVRLVRLVRLIRVVRISSLLAREKKSELDEEVDKKKQQEDDQEKRVQASRLGKILSESTTRRVIIGVLSMMIIWPNLEVSVSNIAPVSGLELLYYHGRSPCGKAEQYFNDPAGLRCNDTLARDEPWMTVEGWEFLVYHYSTQSRILGDETEPGPAGHVVPQRLLSLRVPNFREGGKMGIIRSVKTTRCAATNENLEDLQFYVPEGGLPPIPCEPGMCCWSEHDVCGETNPKDNCPWRDSEIKTFQYTPKECGDVSSSCAGLSLEAKFLMRHFTEMEAKLSMGLTTFVVFLLGFGSMSFSNDTQKLVIAPIEKMVNIVKQLADDPLKKPDITPEDEAESVEVGQPKKNSGQLETGMLEMTILKIGSLLQVGYGECGAQIIGQNMSSSDGVLNILKPGRKVIGIYGFCRINDFMEITQCLLEEVMVFVNKIGHIVHTCVHEWRGAANKNMGDSFMVTWMVPDKDEQERMLKGGLECSDKMQELTDRSLIAFIKVLNEIRRAADLAAYGKHPKIIPRFGVSYKVSMCCSLHAGWGVEGAIGSKHKIDASYISPHVNIAARVLDITPKYGVELLFTDSITDNLCTKARVRTRKVDCVLLKASVEPISVHTFDLTKAIVPVGEGHSVGQIVPVKEKSMAELASAPVDFIFVMDQDIVGSDSAHRQEGITGEFIACWCHAYDNYVRGTWDEALTMFQRCTNLLLDSDGPSECLIAFIQEHACVPPPSWKGYRVMLSK